VSNRNYRIGSVLHPLAFQLWFAKQIWIRTTLRLRYIMQVFCGRELRHALTEPSHVGLDIWANKWLYSIATLRLQEEPSLSGRNTDSWLFSSPQQSLIRAEPLILMSSGRPIGPPSSRSTGMSRSIAFARAFMETPRLSGGIVRIFLSIVDHQSAQRALAQLQPHTN
jgi:hypothetical protein